ncbi:hypothetical protein KCU83_g118, partial [Aureobasidium melanogenum]
MMVAGLSSSGAAVAAVSSSSSSAASSISPSASASSPFNQPYSSRPSAVPSAISAYGRLRIFDGDDAASAVLVHDEWNQLARFSFVREGYAIVLLQSNLPSLKSLNMTSLLDMPASHSAPPIPGTKTAPKPLPGRTRVAHPSRDESAHDAVATTGGPPSSFGFVTRKGVCAIARVGYFEDGIVKAIQSGILVGLEAMGWVCSEESMPQDGMQRRGVRGLLPEPEGPQMSVMVPRPSPEWVAPRMALSCSRPVDMDRGPRDCRLRSASEAETTRDLREDGGGPRAVLQGANGGGSGTAGSDMLMARPTATGHGEMKLLGYTKAIRACSGHVQLRVAGDRQREARLPTTVPIDCGSDSPVRQARSASCPSDTPLPSLLSQLCRRLHRSA